MGVPLPRSLPASVVVFWSQTLKPGLIAAATVAPGRSARLAVDRYADAQESTLVRISDLRRSFETVGVSELEQAPAFARTP